MKWKLGLIFVFVFAVAILATPAFSSDKAMPRTTKDTVSNDTATVTAAAVDGAAPQIFYPDSVYDFGEVSQKQSLTHVFKVQNTGDAPLKLIDARAS